VVPSQEMERFWRRAAEEVGAMFDPVSGEVDKAHLEAARAAVYRDLTSEPHVDAVSISISTPSPAFFPAVRPATAAAATPRIGPPMTSR
jgi:hypothetical protein